jgi:hypothetical protein
MNPRPRLHFEESAVFAPSQSEAKRVDRRFADPGEVLIRVGFR